MRHARARRLVSVLLLLALPGCTVQCKTDSQPSATWLEADPQERRAAIQASERFLAHVDRGELGETWPEVADAAKQEISQSMWELAIGGLRKTAGKTTARELLDVRYTEDLPDAAPGRYFVVECDTRFSRFAATERVVSRFEAGEWRVAGYELYSH